MFIFSLLTRFCKLYLDKLNVISTVCVVAKSFNFQLRSNIIIVQSIHVSVHFVKGFLFQEKFLVLSSCHELKDDRF